MVTIVNVNANYYNYMTKIISGVGEGGSILISPNGFEKI